MKGVFLRQADLDTLATAYVLGVGPLVRVTVVAGDASEAALANPATLCLECGDSGGAGRGNYDHHAQGRDDPPACVQALAARPTPDPWVRELVGYAAAVDRAEPPARARHWPDLSHLVSGLRLVAAGEEQRFRQGLEVLSFAHRNFLDPYGPLRSRPAWEPFLEAKTRARAALAAAAESVVRFVSDAGRPGGWLESWAPGGHGLLRSLGCEIAVASSPPAASGRRRYTVSSARLRVAVYLPALNALEPGWGGPSHGTILGSPPGGSALAPGELLGVLRDDWPPPGNEGTRRTVKREDS